MTSLFTQNQEDGSSQKFPLGGKMIVLISKSDDDICLRTWASHTHHKEASALSTIMCYVCWLWSWYSTRVTQDATARWMEKEVEPTSYCISVLLFSRAPSTPFFCIKRGQGYFQPQDREVGQDSRVGKAEKAGIMSRRALVTYIICSQGAERKPRSKGWAEKVGFQESGV